MRTATGRLVWIFAVGLSAATAHADPRAEAAFQRGREALQVGSYREACAAFEESNAIDPQGNTQFNIALCSEELGKLGTALRIHRDLAQRDDHQWKAKAAELARQLEPRAPRARIGVVKRGKKRPPKGVVVTVNGLVADDPRDVPVDLGPNSIVVTAPGYQTFSGSLSATAEGRTFPLDVRLDVDASAPPVTEPTEPEEPDEPAPGGRSIRKPLGIGTTIVGGLALIGGGIAGLASLDRWQQVDALCPDARCPAPDFARANELRDEARSYGSLSTGLFVGGGALVATGLLLWLTAPSATDDGSVALSPSVSPTYSGLSLRGRF